MPFLTKRVISQFIRRDCKRQLRLLLSPDNADYRAERENAGMPDPHRPRPGLELIAQAGREWESEKIQDLIQTFGSEYVTADDYINENGDVRFHDIELIDCLSENNPGKFLAQPSYEVTTSFIRANNLDRLDLDFGALRPDLIQLRDHGTAKEAVKPDGTTELIDEGDARTPLRVIDIKLTSEPSAAYFAEVTYYAIVLAGWLRDHNLADQYFVSADLSVWPGSHEGSNIVQTKNEYERQGVTPDPNALLDALQEDLQSVPFSVFSSRLQRFFETSLPDVLNADDWEKLPWHVDNKCTGCQYLGNQWVDDPNEKHCMPLAEQEQDLSRVAYISRGASDALEESGVETVPDLAKRSPDDKAFKNHHTLRATRTVVSGRANSLFDGKSEIPPAAGSSAIMPRWADLRVYLAVDFDVGSAITLSLGLKAVWIEPDAYDDPELNFWDEQTFVVDRKELTSERRELLHFLEQIHQILNWADNQDSDTTVQFYIWDQVQYKHLTRIVGRHLHTILNESGYDYLAWLFPPDNVVPDQDHGSRETPITIVGDVVRAVLAAPVPHVYSLLNVAREYHHESLDNPDSTLSVHPHFEDDFSSLIPSERAHEIWSREGGDYPWHEQLEDLKDTVETRLFALETVTRRLEEDLRAELGNTAPKIDIGSPERETRIGWDGQLWMAFAKLNAALEKMDIESGRAMPTHEREARFKSALLSKRVERDEREMILEEHGIDDENDTLVYELESGSTEVKFREGDFTLCLAPDQDTSELNRGLYHLVRDEGIQHQVNLPESGWKYQIQLEDVTEVRIELLDREEQIIVLSRNSRHSHIMDQLEEEEVYDFSENVSLEQSHADFFTDKLRCTLRSIGNPDIQRDNPLVRRAVGLESARRGRKTDHTPVADVLWNAGEMNETSLDINTNRLKRELKQQGIRLNESQWETWETASSNRLELIWGPPGTGKSRTVRAITLGKILKALNENKSDRILITAPTYNALDTVLEDVLESLLDWGRLGELSVHRLRSKWREGPEGVLKRVDTEMNKAQLNERARTLRSRLDDQEGLTVVAATPQQVHNLIRTWGEEVGQRELFDHILVDEASQMDVGHSILAYAGIADGGSLVVAGDPLQLAPIHEAEPPEGLESMVGSTYEFFRDIHDVHESKLLRNYRSNEELVAFQRSHEYPRELHARSPDLEIELLEGIPSEPPEHWSANLPWGDYLQYALNPDKSSICLTYDGGLDSQWNEFESQVVTSVVMALKGRLSSQLKNDDLAESSGNAKTVYSAEGFWEQGVGVVTPHKAQEASIIRHLQRHAESREERELIRDTVDTVERFQGQQRDVIIASYAVSDPDLIGDEDEFLQEMNRFNVLQSRARAKLIVLVSDQIIQHLSSDMEILAESALLKNYSMVFCDSSKETEITIPDEDARTVSVRYHSPNE